MSDDTGFQWVEFVPPRRASRPPAYGYEALEQLQANPGRWAKLHHYANKGSAGSAVTHLRKKGYEAEHRTTEDGGSDVYACWPGEADGTPTPIRPPRADAAVANSCDFCSESFDTPGGLKHHVRRRHPERAA